MSQAARNLIDDASRALAAGRTQDALAKLRAVLEAFADGPAWDALMPLLARTLSAAGRTDALASLALAGVPVALDAAALASPLDRARMLERGERFADAARAYADGGYHAHAAFCAERAGRTADTVAHWRALLAARSERLDPYTRALSMVNLARALERGGEARGARASMIEGIRLLEATAAHFEASGARERAFDCYQVLISLGRDAAFENLAEGYLGCIRILRDDHLRTYVLQYYEDFQRLALERGEHQAAATLFREAASYCRTQRLAYGAHYAKQAAEAHASTAMTLERRGASPEIVENAYLAAAECFAELGAFSKTRAVYGSLAALELAEARRQRYRRLASKLDGARDEPLEIVAFPDAQRSPVAYPDVWRLDVLEWELGGDLIETMGDVLLDKGWPERTKQRALACRVRAQLAGGAPSSAERATLCGLAAATEIYPVLAIIERYARDADASVRAAAMRGLQQLYFKRAFVSLRTGLSDDDASVRAQAEAALSKLYFPHAFDPLQRILRESRSASVRKTALSSIARIATREAAELLVGVMSDEPGPLSTHAAELVRDSRNPHLEQALRDASESASEQARPRLSAALSAKRQR